MLPEYVEGAKVTIHSLGPSHGDKTYRGIIRGISHNFGVDPATSYIVELVDNVDPEYNYSHCCMPAACLRRGWA